MSVMRTLYMLQANRDSGANDSWEDDLRDAVDSDGLSDDDIDDVMLRCMPIGLDRPYESCEEAYEVRVLRGPDDDTDLDEADELNTNYDFGVPF